MGQACARQDCSASHCLAERYATAGEFAAVLGQMKQGSICNPCDTDLAIFGPKVKDLQHLG
jgi:hypothetical protein